LAVSILSNDQGRIGVSFDLADEVRVRSYWPRLYSAGGMD